MTAPNAYFSCSNMHSYYGESYIVQGVGFQIQKGEIVALLGRNGAGKTSTLRSIARLDAPRLQRGEIWLDGQPLHTMSAYQASRLGVGLVPEDRRIIPSLTVEENLQLAQIEEPIGWSIERIYDHFPRLAERRKQEAVTMSGGEQQMLAIGRALLSKPALMMLDEPSLGLSPLLVQALFGLLKDLNRDGLSILLVEQNTHMALATAHRAYVLELGRLVLQGNAQDIAADPRMAAAYLGA